MTPARAAPLPRPFRRAFAAALMLGSVVAGASAAAEGPEVIVSHGISAFGDLKYPADFPHFDYVNPDAPKGGLWSGRGTGAVSTFDSLNPFILKGNPAQGLGATFDSLLAGSADEPDSAYGLLAHRIEYPADRTWVIFHMRPEARFSDDSPVTAHDVVWTFETLRDLGSPNIRLRLRDIASAEALDDHTVRFDFTPGVSTRDLPALAGSLSILSRDWWEGRDFTESGLTPILGSGPYIVETAQQGRSITYRRRPDYWGADLPVNVGANNFDRLTFEYFRDNTLAFEGLKGGSILFHEEFFSRIWATGYDFPAVQRGWVVQAEIPDARPSGTQGFWINMRRPQFQDPRVREALGYGFDFEWSNRTLFFDLYTRTEGFFGNSPMHAEGPPPPEELALLEPLAEHFPAHVLTDPPHTPPVSNGSGQDRSLLRRGMALLDEAGWEVGSDGLRRNAEGQTLRVEFLDDAPTFERIIGPYVQNLRRMGVDASLRIVDPTQYQARAEQFDFDVVPGRFVMSLTPGPVLRNLFGSESVDQPGTPNYTGLANPAVDALIEKVVQAPDRESMYVAARALDRVLRSLHIWVPNWYKGAYHLAYWDVFGRPDEPPLYSRGDAYWWWDEDRAAALRAAGAPLRTAAP